MLLRLHRQCSMGMGGMCFPDGKAVLDQPLVLLDAFDVISRAVAALKPEA